MLSKSKLIVALLALSTAALFAQQPADTTTLAPKPPAQKQKGPSQVYYGGTIGLSFGDYFRISVTPLVGYKVNPKTSVGLKIGYEYIEDKRYEVTLKSSNYGGSVFTRYRFHPKIYAHGEFAYFSYKYQTPNLASDRTWVPFLLVGGGLVQPVSPSASLFVEVLFDVLQDSNSPYESGSPLISIGVGVGF